MARVIVIEGADTGLEVEIERPTSGDARELVVGRDPRVALPLGDSAVSREHCRIEVGERGCRVLDLGSRNRTFLNGDPIDNAWLRDGDTITVGDTVLRFEDDAPSVEGSGVASTIIKSLAPRDPATWHPADAESGAESLQRALAVARSASSAKTSDELFGALFADLLPSLHAARGAFLTIRRGRWRVTLKSDDHSGRFQPGLTVVEQVASERTALLSSCADTDGERSVLAAPVLGGGGDLLGVVWVERAPDEAPFDVSDLELLDGVLDPVGQALERIESDARLRSENRALVRTIADAHRIVGESQAIVDVLDFIRRAAPTSMTVLIRGETGTGKELVASAIHYGSPRSGRPLVALNCAALPDSLVESELFGHERGAFTGAVARKKGRFELADRGTVFLDEIGELSLACQAKLLRLLEERRFERVGGSETVEVDVRVIAATNRNLLDMVEEGEFREDLYYRISVLEVEIPPLRERPEDIPLLVRHFLAPHVESGRPHSLSKAAEKRLARYGWPGNVRQLRNVVESAVVLGDGDEIGAEDLVLPEKRPSGDASWEPISLQELERQHVLRVLEHTGGNKKRAAELLGIERCTLYSKLKNYDS